MIPNYKKFCNKCPHWVKSNDWQEQVHQQSWQNHRDALEWLDTRCNKFTEEVPEWCPYILEHTITRSKMYEWKYKNRWNILIVPGWIWMISSILVDLIRENYNWLHWLNMGLLTVLVGQFFLFKWLLKRKSKRI